MMEHKHTVQWRSSNACKQLARHEPHEDRDEWRSLMTAEESSSWSY